MKIIDSRISRNELTDNYLGYFKTMIKVVVDVQKDILAIDAELHSDLEAYLLENGSEQENLWGINLYPFKDKNDFIEYTSLINIRPHQDNFSMEVENLEIRKRITGIIDNLVEYES
ncbi:MAG: hypothetical protein HZC45_03040 [Deltaproteobacteria bacterium]|nr:hypothetical protein [Deltaproteobacteria bacterium]